MFPSLPVFVFIYDSRITNKEDEDDAFKEILNIDRLLRVENYLTWGSIYIIWEEVFTLGRALFFGGGIMVTPNLGKMDAFLLAVSR